MKSDFEMKLSGISTGANVYKIKCSRLIRQVPNKREVYDGFCDDEPAIVKIFCSKLHARRHFTRELRGVKKLLDLGVSSPKLLAYGKTEQGQYVIVTQKIQDAEDVFSLIHRVKEESLYQEVIKAVVSSLSKMNQQGVEQVDLHLGNFLWSNEQVYVLDPAEMKFHKGPLSDARSIKQLAVFFAGSSSSLSKNVKELLEQYFEARGRILTDSLLKRIERSCWVNRKKQIAKTLKKTLRNSKRYVRLSESGVAGSFRKDYFAETKPLDFMRNIDSVMDAGNALKRGNTCYVSKIKLGDADVVAKRYNHKGFIHSLRHTLKGSRARRCWLFGYRLRELGIPCAMPVAFVEKRKLGIIWESYIINEFVGGNELRNIMVGSKCSDSEKKELLDKSERLLKKLVGFGMTHGDMKASNIMIRAGEPVVIDLDSMKKHFTPLDRNYYARKMFDRFERGVQKGQDF